MSATTAAAILGAPIAIPTGLRNGMIVVLGVMLGSSFSPEILDRIGQWALSLTLLALYALVAGALGFLYFRRLFGFDPVTAYFSAMPGGISEMMLAGSEMGGNGRVISLVHTARILLVVLALPIGFRVLAGYEPGARPPAGVPLAEVPLDDLGVLLACGVLGFLVARALRLPAAPMIGAMIVSAAAHLSGWTTAVPPFELIAASQVGVGSAIGCRFAGLGAREIGRIALAASGGTVILMAVTLVFALALNAGLGLPIQVLVLAFAPGGTAEMSLIAIALGSEVAFVATHHVVRIIMVVVCAPLIFRLARGRRRTEP